jgi:hypothetical protein
MRRKQLQTESQQFSMRAMIPFDDNDLGSQSLGIPGVQVQANGRDMGIQDHSFWPICAVCEKVVEKLEVLPLPPKANRFRSSIRDYVVTCHGKEERSMVGLWAVAEIGLKKGRLPEAFKGDR